MQSGIRPVIIAQNDVGNKYSPTIHVIPLTKQLKRAKTQPTHVTIYANENNGLKSDSVALVEDMSPIPANCLTMRIGKISLGDVEKLTEAFKIQFPFAG